ncbi:hypothetical protein CGRA01v4_08754 [Colletotrichum graminicola]|nr:hypothetical protein CGRA01v4_08754 [Colletotrichum graminicola]
MHTHRSPAKQLPNHHQSAQAHSLLRWHLTWGRLTGLMQYVAVACIASRHVRLEQTHRGAGATRKTLNSSSTAARLFTWHTWAARTVCVGFKIGWSLWKVSGLSHDLKRTESLEGRINALTLCVATSLVPRWLLLLWDRACPAGALHFHRTSWCPGFMRRKSPGWSALGPTSIFYKP